MHDPRTTSKTVQRTPGFRFQDRSGVFFFEDLALNCKPVFFS